MNAPADGHGMKNLEAALSRLSAIDDAAANGFAVVAGAVADAAVKDSRLRRVLSRLAENEDSGVNDLPLDGKLRSSRRRPGAIDPFSVYAAGGVAGLRSSLGELDLEQLRDLLAEHRMDRDRLAMRWKSQERVIDRIVETVELRAEKGNAFRV